MNLSVEYGFITGRAKLPVTAGNVVEAPLQV